jgi:hypothetical protein
VVALLLTAALAAPAVPAVPCRQGLDATMNVAARDAVIGPLVLIGGNRHARHEPNGFEGHGFKMPVTLPADVKATLKVPPSMGGKVGLVFRQAVQDRVIERGVRAADRALRFTACTGEGRTGWPGGLVVDRPRCVTLVVEVQGRPAVRQRVPLGRPCRE